MQDAISALEAQVSRIYSKLEEIVAIDEPLKSNKIQSGGL